MRAAVRPPTSCCTRSFISFAARFVNVIARISLGRRGAGLDQVGDPVGEDAGLARPGARDDQHRPVGVHDRLALLRVERVEQRVAWRRPPRSPRDAGTDGLGSAQALT